MPNSGEETGAGEFGTSVALSADGNTAIVGAEFDGGNSDGGPGAAWVFTRPDFASNQWTEQGGKLVPSDEAGNGDFGASVALSADGTIALIGGPADNGQGAAWVFTGQGGVLAQQGSKLTDTTVVTPANQKFGQSVALSADGATGLIGEPGAGGGGAAWVFFGSNLTASGPDALRR